MGKWIYNSSQYADLRRFKRNEFSKVLCSFFIVHWIVDASADDFQASCCFAYDNPYCHYFTHSNFDIDNYPLSNTIGNQNTSSNPDTFYCDCDSDKGHNGAGPHFNAKLYSNKYGYVYSNQL